MLQFISGLKHILVGKLFKLSSQSNFKSDRATNLAELNRLPVPSAPAASAEDDFQPIFDDSDAAGTLELHDVIQANVHFCITGNMIKQFLRKVHAPPASRLFSIRAVLSLTVGSTLECP